MSVRLQEIHKLMFDSFCCPSTFKLPVYSKPVGINWVRVSVLAFLSHILIFLVKKEMFFSSPGILFMTIVETNLYD